MDNKTKFLILGSTITAASAMVGFVLAGYKRENPSDILSFDVLKACPVMVSDGEDECWTSGSIMLCQNKKGKPVIIINRNNHPNAIFARKICSWGVKDGDIWIKFLNHMGKIKRVLISDYDGDNRVLSRELARFFVLTRKNRS